MSDGTRGSKAEKQRGSPRQGMIRLVGREAGDPAPDVAVYLLDKRQRVIHTAQVDDEGRFDLPDDLLKKSTYVALGPGDQDFGDIPAETRFTYRTSRFVGALRDFPVLEIPRPDWLQWLFVTRCVSGSVSHCYPYPWLVADLYRQAGSFGVIQMMKYDAASPQIGVRGVKALRQFGGLQDAVSQFAKFPFQRCETVCDGIVEVYRRRCCCKPWIIDDWRIPDLLDILDDLLERVPVFPWPPIPDPPPYLETPFFTGGAFNEMAFNARQDVIAIRRLPQEQRAAYIQERAYLAHFFCTCGEAVKVAEGTIRVDGGFSICWKEPLFFETANCYEEYAYVVKQLINGSTTTIYDGVAANKWFEYEEEAVLVSHHPQAQGCRHNDFPGDGAFALLQDIGLTPSHRLKTPDATGWDRVAAPGYNDGLADAVANPADALGQFKNRNWGGTLYLRYHFSEEMKGAGAHFYRISVSAADNNGNPTGTRAFLGDSLAWNKYVDTGMGINVETEGLGPFSAGGENNLFRIPYDDDADWQSGQYHGYLDTTDFTQGRYLVTMEVFNAAGARLRPTGAGGAGLDTPFTFRRWFQPVGPTADVPYAALTHMFWWDNRRAAADIIDLRRNGVPSEEECQFMEGPGATTFSAGYVAYHPEAMFLLDHSMSWRRGLNGPSGVLINHNPFNVGPAMGVSPAATFADMLGAEAKCSFSLFLHSRVKTTNGIGTLDGLDGWDTAAFALEIT
ncbi:MAG: hypothetical protein L0Z70_05390 [Chloroflexi bacterium]|nr:hypothetical protein [Chloroflexota bacterium]